MEQIEKKLSEITMHDWIMFDWIETSAMGGKDREFIRGQRRTPAEAFRAAEEWEFLRVIENQLEEKE